MKYSDLSDGTPLDGEQLFVIQEGTTRGKHACLRGACAKNIEDVAHLCEDGICQTAANWSGEPTDPPPACTTDSKSHN